MVPNTEVDDKTDQSTISTNVVGKEDTDAAQTVNSFDDQEENSVGNVGPEGDESRGDGDGIQMLPYQVRPTVKKEGMRKGKWTVNSL